MCEENTFGDQYSEQALDREGNSVVSYRGVSTETSSGSDSGRAGGGESDEVIQECNVVEVSE
jgi:hypothetical protein